MTLRILKTLSKRAAPLTEGQQRFVLGSEPDDMTGAEGAGVELWTGADYAIAKSLERRGLGSVKGPGQPKGMPGLYFNNAEGLRLRAALLGPDSARCINHADKPAVTNLDGEDLCQDCANAWVRAEGEWQGYLEAESAAHQREEEQ